MKDVRLTGLDASTHVISAWVQRPSTAVAYLIISQTQAAGALTSWEGWVTASAGDQLVFHATGGAVAAWFSGTKLIGSAP
jgi:hypothetical protein